MSSSSWALLSLQELLDAWKTVPLADGLTLFGQVLEQVRSLHASGHFHRSIGPSSIVVDPHGKPCLLPAEPMCRLGGLAKLPAPPELREIGEIALPCDRSEAAEVLARAGVPIDPVRIDVYQLGALLCRLLSGQPVAGYLHSPRIKAAVPAGLQPVIDRALGFDPSQRHADCEQLAADFSSARASQSMDSAITQPSVSLQVVPASPAHLDETSVHSWGPRASFDPEAPLPFESLGPYRILERLGQGGMGDVYLAYEEALQRKVALKVLPGDLASNDEFVRRFRNEATAVARLEHPNIVPIYGTGREGGAAYFAMQYVEGESLEQRLARFGRLSVEETLSILEQCLAGLGAAHEAGLVHRDIKPGNILLHARTQRALVADFGLVKSNEPDGGATAVGVVMGTVDYIAPEQARGLEVDGRTDLYAVGVMAYRMLSGRLPFQADTATAMIFQHAYETPQPLAEVVPDLPISVAVLVGRLMAKDPAARYPGCAAVLADIQRYRAGEPLAELPAPEPGLAPHQGLKSAGLQGRGPQSRLGRLRQRMGEWLMAHGANVLFPRERTLGQVDGVLALHQQKRDALARLVDEALATADELAVQAERCRAEGAVQATERARQDCERSAARLEQQAADQQEQLAQLQMRLAEVDALLGSMRHQRELLHARLRVAEAELPGKDRSSRRRQRVATVLALMVGLGSLLALGSYLLPTRVPTGPEGGSVEAPEKTVAPEGGRFLLLSQDGRFRRPHATLASAVEAASGGDTIEIQDNGPFLSGFVQVKAPLRIRAAPGARPIITFQPAPVEQWWQGVLIVSAPLMLEGIELRYHRPTLGGAIELIEAASDLRMTNCRVVAQGEANALFLKEGRAELDRCEIFTGPWGGIRWNFDDAAQLVLNDCVLAGGECLVWHSYREGPPGTIPSLDLQLNRCTLVGQRAIFNWLLEHPPRAPERNAQPLHVKAAHCVFSLAPSEQGFFTVTATDPTTIKEDGPARKLPRQAILWTDDDNLYPEQDLLTLVRLEHGELHSAHSLCKTLEDWREFGNIPRTSSRQGIARLEGSDILAKLQASASDILPTDFRLSPGSPGAGSGPDGDDLGARVGLVGPGRPYQEWRRQSEKLLKKD